MEAALSQVEVGQTLLGESLEAPVISCSLC
jgi:hypothetical protein